MTLDQQFSIATRHQRSTRIDSDLSADFFPSLVFHGTAQSALETLIRQFSQTGQSSYTLTGPYGSGKSTIALLLLGLLNHEKTIRTTARNAINAETRKLIDLTLPIKSGWLEIRSVGSTSNPIETFWTSTLNALEEHPNTENLAKKYKNSCPKNEAELVSNWELLFTEAQEFVDGAIIIADEMGKSLEYINKNKGELHLFQDLAEVLGRIETPVIFLGLLHQSFSEYAKERGTKLQEEWAKIQGRYTDILYNVSTDETVALIAKSITLSNPELSDNTSYVKTVLNALDDSKTRKDQLYNRLKATAPLHPLVSLILGPISKRRFSQNERSTFSFLNSHEQSSFQLFLKNTSDINARYCLRHLWDYLELNLEHAILNSPDGRSWAEASEVINRIDVPETTLNILKSIALINLFGKQAKLYASTLMLKSVLEINDPMTLEEHLNLLKTNSAIIFRKHQNAWVIFEGSDIDIPTLLDKQIEQLSNSNEAIANLDFHQQIMAKGHYHTTGSLRWAEQVVKQNLAQVDFDKLLTSDSGEFAHFILLIESTDTSELEKITKKYNSVAFANAINAEDISTYAKEVYALELLKNDKEIGASLQHDKVALKEFESRLNEAQKMLHAAIEEGFSNSRWTLKRRTNQKLYPLSELVSDLADTIFCDVPKILNELVNRNKISGTAVSARKKLLEAMLSFSDNEDLEITGFPPEKSMYISCLKNTKLHIFEDNKWIWSRKNIASEIKTLFKETDNYLKEKSLSEKVNLEYIEKMWARPPYGISAGVFPILCFAYLKTLDQDIAYYEKAMSGDFEFITKPDIDYIHKLQKAPKDLAIKFIRLNEKDRNWLQQLSVFAAALTSTNVKPSLLSVATPLVTAIYSLPNWVRNSSNLVSDNAELNKKTLQIRDLFLQANDPYELLIEQLIKVIDPKNTLSSSLQINEIEKCFNILKSAHEKMLEKMNLLIKQFFPEKGEELINMCKIVEKKSGDLRLKSFARELAKSQKFGLKWLESLLAVVIGRGINNWNESSLLTAEQKISNYAQDFLRIIKADNSLNITGETNNKKTTSISLVWENGKGELEAHSKEIVVADKKIIEPVKKAIFSKLASLNEFEKIDVLKQLLQEALEDQYEYKELS